MCDTCIVSPVRGCVVSIQAVEYELVHASSAPPASSALVPRLTGRQPTTKTDTAPAHWAAAATAANRTPVQHFAVWNRHSHHSIASLLPSHLPTSHPWILGYIPSILHTHTHSTSAAPIFVQPITPPAMDNFQKSVSTFGQSFSTNFNKFGQSVGNLGQQARERFGQVHTDDITELPEEYRSLEAE